MIWVQAEKAAIEKLMAMLEANRPASATELKCVHAGPASDLPLRHLHVLADLKGAHRSAVNLLQHEAACKRARSQIHTRGTHGFERPQPSLCVVTRRRKRCAACTC